MIYIICKELQSQDYICNFPGENWDDGPMYNMKTYEWTVNTSVRAFMKSQWSFKTWGLI